MRGTIHARKTIRGSIGYPTLKGEPGEDGYSPQASVTKTGNTATITITDKSGTTTAQVTDGAKGDPGQDGISPSATVAQTANGATITITDKTGTTTATVTNGQDGDDGYSPSASVSKSGRIATITVTDKTGTTTAQVSDGQDGTPAIIDAMPTEDSPNAVSSGGVYDELSDLKSDLNQKYEKPSTGIPASDIASGVIPDVPVQDVQVNGTSILDAQGVANVPKASENALGVVIVGNGLQITASGRLLTNYASNATIKAQESEYNPITPKYQHVSAFYALAKAAGDTTQSSSSNAVGTYTEEAKIKIQKMLGIYEAPFRIIKEITISEETGSFYVNTELNNDPLSLSEVLIFFDSVVGTNNGAAYIFFNNGTQTSTGNDKLLISANNVFYSSAISDLAHAWVSGGRFFGENVDGLTTATTRKNPYTNMNACGILTCNAINEIFCYSPNGFKWTSGTIKIIGR